MVPENKSVIVIGNGFMCLQYHKYHPTRSSPQLGSAAQVVPAIAPKVKEIN